MMGNKNNQTEAPAVENQTEAPAVENQTEAPAPVKDKEADWVYVHIPRAYANDDPSFFVSVNGKNYNLPRGKRVKVPPAVAAEVERAERAQQRYEETASERELKQK